MRHYIVKFQPDGKRIRIHQGATILEAAHQAGIILNTVCGANGTCGKCKVQIAPDQREVLACQEPVESDITVTIPSDSRFFAQKILEHGLNVTINVHPTVIKLYIKPDSAQPHAIEALLNKVHPQGKHFLASQTKIELGRIDYDYLSNGITFVCHHEPSEVEICRKLDGKKCIYHVVDFDAGDTTGQLYGVSVDIGTTTVVAQLFDLIDGRELATASDFNPQARYGDDVISRISHVESDEKLNELQKVIIECLNQLINELIEKAGVDKNNIYEFVAVGNTTMNHLFLGLPVEQLGQAPYLAHSLEAYDLPAQQLRLDINPVANIHTVENIAGFVGADTTAAALATAMNRVEKMTLLVDIGTNGEIVLGTKDKLYSASCAAGPAFEGARITQGSRAVDGAIEAVVINEHDIDIDVIGDDPPSSICGSGLIDAIAVMLDLGALDPTGRFVKFGQLKEKLPEQIFQRLLQIDNEPAFVLAYKEENTPAVSLLQKDIRQVQLGKAAIRTGIKLLQMKLDLKDEDIEQVLLAGAFGNYIRKTSALTMGLLPDVPIERIHFVGNAAGIGAQMVLLDRKARGLAKELSEKIEYVEIAHMKEFSDFYAESMLF